jgi:hypothetical protein
MRNEAIWSEDETMAGCTVFSVKIESKPEGELHLELL